MARLTRWGNASGLRIPKAILEAAGLCVGDEIGCHLLDSGAILLTPRKGRIEVSGEKPKVATAHCEEVKW